MKYPVVANNKILKNFYSNEIFYISEVFLFLYFLYLYFFYILKSKPQIKKFETFYFMEGPGQSTKIFSNNQFFAF